MKGNHVDIASDLQPANILFTLNKTFSPDNVLPPEFSPVHWLPGTEVDSSAPRYLIVSQRPRGFLDETDSSALIVEIGDLGGGTYSLTISCVRLDLLTRLIWYSDPIHRSKLYYPCNPSRATSS